MSIQLYTHFFNLKINKINYIINKINFNIDFVCIYVDRINKINYNISTK